jgi:hypothetical protein
MGDAGIRTLALVVSGGVVLALESPIDGMIARPAERRPSTLCQSSNVEVPASRDTLCTLGVILEACEGG